jgi:hypothetical protein
MPCYSKRVKVTVELDLPRNWKSVLAYRKDRKAKELRKVDLKREVENIFEAVFDDFIYEHMTRKG